MEDNNKTTLETISLLGSAEITDMLKESETIKDRLVKVRKNEMEITSSEPLPCTLSTLLLSYLRKSS